MASYSPAPGVPGLVIEAVEWLPSGGDTGLVRVRGRWVAVPAHAAGLPELALRRGAETRRFTSLPDARFAGDPTVWRATYVVGAALMDPAPDDLWVAWESGARAALQAPARGFEPPPRPAAPAAAASEAGGEVIDRAVLAERRARRAEAAERAQAERAAEAIAALEVLELRSAELERRLEALQGGAGEEPAAPVAVAAPEPAPEPEAAARAALAAAVETVKQLRIELDEQRHRVRRSELLRAADEVALATLRADHGRLDELERALADARAARDQAAEQVALAQQRAARDAATVRGAADAVRRDLAAAREQVAAREAELAAIGEDLAALRAELETVRADAAARADELQARLAELEASLQAERAAHAVAATELETARSALAAAEAARRAESVARATLEEELDRERLLRIALAGALDTARSEAAERIATLEAELAAARGAPDLLAHIAELERTADDDLARRGAEHAAAAAAAPADPAGERLAANLDAAAATLRARAAVPPAMPAPAVAAPPATGLEIAARPPAAPTVAASPATGAHSRRHPWLRAALVALARDDPARAARLLLGLVPAQRALVGYPLEYDLLIRGTGLYAVSITAGGASARAIERPRPRRAAAFHAAADVVALAELLAGAEKRMGRWSGSIRIRGKRGRARGLRAALMRSDLSLGAAARAGAQLAPDVVFPAFAYAVDPEWTRGQRFTVAQEILDPEPERWHLTARDGAPLAVTRNAPQQAPPDAVVSMSRATFDRLLRGEPALNGQRPQIRGDRAAVATLKAWTDRAQAR